MNHKAYKFRIYPTKSQETLLNQTFGCVRFLWNKHVEAFNSFSKEGPNRKVTSKILKDTHEYSWLNTVSAAALQQKDMDFTEFQKQHFDKKRKSKVGRPKFKKRGLKESYRLPNQKFSIDQPSKKIRLEKIGKVKLVMDREIPSTVRLISVTVSKTTTNEFYVSILVEEEIKLKGRTGNSIGIDLGFIDICTMSDGTVIGNPRWFRKNQAKLAKEQKSLSRKKISSNRRERQRLKVSTLHQKISRQRNWYHHQVSSYIVENYDTICMENLNIAGMKKLFGKSASDVGLATLVSQIEYKSKWYGKTFHKVDQFFASSKTCSVCGVKTQFGLGVREWDCPSCHSHHDRDLNAAINILKKGLQDLYDYTSDELTEVIGRRGDVSLQLGAMHPVVATSVKRQVEQFCTV